MEQSERRQSVTPEEVLDTFDQRDDRSEPLTTGEIANMLGCSRRAVRRTLLLLAEQGKIASKTMDGKAKVWWRTNLVADRVASDIVERLSKQNTRIYKHVVGLVEAVVSRLYSTLERTLVRSLPSQRSETRGVNKSEASTDAFANEIASDDSFWETSGMLPPDEPSDVSSNVDRYLYRERGNGE
ncbi:HTH domain-containing protein [Halococcus dombrowskii]|uniref:HTH domain-containing protein n=1 Tax=Halococcus dombrowskii TaxID=179637 RepID=A0AAV3SKG1_HALDO|nr:HTH domain-containing protein [Halococcus dombrowskii]UOO94081.1 HTH domain-containing protein [Halococcus dombrowskii]